MSDEQMAFIEMLKDLLETVQDKDFLDSVGTSDYKQGFVDGVFAVEQLIQNCLETIQRDSGE